MANLGYVGLGAMGGNMADLLMAKGHKVTGYNRTASKADWLVKKGMTLAASPKAVAQAADVIFVMVTNSAADEAVFNGPDGLLAAMGPGKVIIDMSTVSPAVSRGLAAKVREKGGDMVDAPVSGSIITLQQGKLSVMVGGTKATFDKIKPILDDIGPKVTHVGDNGLALVMKIATNLSLAVQMLAFSEGVLLAEKSGIARETAVDVLTAQRHRVADGRLSRAVRAEDAGRGVVQREHDAEGHAAGAGTGPAGRRPAADHGRRQRMSDGRPRDGAGRRRLRDDLQSPREDVGRETVGPPEGGTTEERRGRSSRARNPSRTRSRRARLRSSRRPSAESACPTSPPR